MYRQMPSLLKPTPEAQMKKIKSWHFKKIALMIAFTLLIISCIPAKSLAYIAGTEEIAQDFSRDSDMMKVRRALEHKLISKKLQAVGLSSDEVSSRVDKLSDEELHSFASQIDNLYPGGDALGVVISLLIIVMLVIIILRMMDRRIVIG